VPRRKFSPNWHRGAFRNPIRTRRNRAVHFLRWRLTDRQALIPPRLVAGAPRVEPDRGRLRDPEAEGITWLGHATTLIQIAGRTLLLDPCWGNPIGFPCRVAEQAMAIEDLPPIDAVLVSHNHPDHLDRRVVRRLDGEPVYAVPLGDERLLRRLRARYVVGFDWWEWHELGHVRITFVPAHHWSQRGLTWNRSLWGGWVIQSPEVTIYYSGDSARMPVLDEIGERFPEIDYALIAAGGYEPRWYMKTVHMNPAEAVETFQALGARTLIPVHWGTLRLGAEPPGEPPLVLRQEFETRGLDPARLRVLAIGETLPIS
jgi:L-ascorbate metabolism protein UlaG (beta-lactamase superfamily)